MQEEQEEEFPFNMSDFVTVDEVGDVADFPDLPLPSVPTETAEADALTEEAPGVKCQPCRFMSIQCKIYMI